LGIIGVGIYLFVTHEITSDSSVTPQALHAMKDINWVPAFFDWAIVP